MHRLFAGLLCFFLAPASGAEPWKGPIFDAHLHYNVEATNPYPVQAAFELFRRNGVAGILANSRPNDGTRALYESAAKAPGAAVAVVPFVRVYRTREDVGTWFDNAEIYRMVVDEEKRGYYRGIGEFHLYGKQAGTKVVKDLVAFAVSRNLVLHAHCDEEALEILFAHDPKARIIWAHTGFTTPLARVEELLGKYPGMWAELSYRFDVAEGGGLASAWKAMFTRHPTRFLLGSDTWTNQRWESYSEIMGGYRQWLGELPREVAEGIAWRNAADIFGLRP